LREKKMHEVQAPKAKTGRKKINVNEDAKYALMK
jgi:hypothetical protein